MSEEALLSEADVRAIVRLVGKTCTIEGSLPRRRSVLLDGLCELINADRWAWAQTAEMRPGSLPVYVGMIYGGFTEDSFAQFVNIQAHPDMAPLSAFISRAMQQEKRHLTRSLAQTVPLSMFMNASVNRLWQECGIYPLLLSYYPLPDGIISGIGIYRRCGGDLCTPREARIAHIVLSQVPWLHAHYSPEAVLTEVPKLPVRQRVALELLLKGESRKAIAEHMHISVNTVSAYVRDIYRYFQVTSQGQLIRRFFQGDGGDSV